MEPEHEVPVPELVVAVLVDARPVPAAGVVAELVVGDVGSLPHPVLFGEGAQFVRQDCIGDDHLGRTMDERRRQLPW